MKITKALCAAGATVGVVALTASPAAAESLWAGSATQDSFGVYYDPDNLLNLCDYAQNDGDGAFVMWREGAGAWRSAVTYNYCETVDSYVADGQNFEMYACDWKYYSGVGRRAVNCGNVYRTSNS